MKRLKRMLISPQAREDIQQAIDFYNNHQKGLGKRFHSEVKRTFSALRRTPEFQVRYDTIRCCPLRVFPYMIHYTFEEETISVWSVIAMAQNPEKTWRK